MTCRFDASTPATDAIKTATSAHKEKRRIKKTCRSVYLVLQGSSGSPGWGIRVAFSHQKTLADPVEPRRTPNEPAAWLLFPQVPWRARRAPAHVVPASALAQSAIAARFAPRVPTRSPP